MTNAQAKSRRASAERQIVAKVERHNAKVAAKVGYYRTVMSLALKAVKYADAEGKRIFRAQADAARKRLNYWQNVKPPVTYSGRLVTAMAGC